MGGEDPKGSEDASPTANAKPSTNAMNNNKGPRTPSEMIQDFEDLFHQELLDVRGADKVFLAWKEVKRVILTRVLDATIKRLDAAQHSTERQGPPLSYADAIKGGPIIIEKPVPKRMDREITILRRECPSLDGE